MNISLIVNLIINNLPAIISVIISLGSNIFLWKVETKRFERSIIKSNKEMVNGARIKNVNDLRIVMSELIGLSYDLYRRGLKAAKSDGGPRAIELREFSEIKMKEVNQKKALIQLLLDEENYRKFVIDLDQFCELISNIANAFIKVEDDKVEVITMRKIQSFQRKCRKVISHERAQIYKCEF